MNCLTNLFQRVHSLPVLSTRWSQRTWYQSAAWIEVKAPVQFPVRVPQRPSTCWARKFSKTMPKVSVQERICNISRAWPDVSHLINVFCRRQKWQILVQKVKNLPGCLHSVSSFTCQWSRNTCGSRQTVAGESLSGLGFSPCGCCRGTLLLPGEPSAGWCTIKYLLAASGGQGSEHSSMLATHMFLLRPCLQVNLRSGQYMHLRSQGTRGAF
nr:uncharacterized protein LOC125990448 isoform X3 [Syngnathus scovelli]